MACWESTTGLGTLHPRLCGGQCTAAAAEVRHKTKGKAKCCSPAICDDRRVVTQPDPGTKGWGARGRKLENGVYSGALGFVKKRSCYYDERSLKLDPQSTSLISTGGDSSPECTGLHALVTMLRANGFPNTVSRVDLRWATCATLLFERQSERKISSAGGPPKKTRRLN